MATELTARGQGSEQPGTPGYETRDADVPWIFGIVIFLICSGIVIQVVLAGGMKHLLRSPSPTDPWVPMRRLTQPVPLGQFPRLQISERMDLRQFRANEDGELTNYAWVNRTSGIVRVPIERAMDLVLQKGLPLRTNIAAGPSSAQLIEKRVLQRSPEDHKQK